VETREKERPMAVRANVPSSEERPRPVELDRWLALGGVLGPAVFTLTYTVAGLLRPGYSPVDQAISDLGVGDNAWLLTGSLILLGLSLLGFTISFYRTIRPPASTALRVVSAALLASVGAGYAVAGIFDETNPLHWQLGAPLVYGGATFGFLLAGVLLRRDRAWRGWGTASLLFSLVTVLLIALTFYTFSSYAYSEGDPSPEGQLGGLMERVLFVEILAWYAAFGSRLFRASPAAF
jgi:hypothetical membrane protein